MASFSTSLQVVVILMRQFYGRLLMFFMIGKL